MRASIRKRHIFRRALCRHQDVALAVCYKQLCLQLFVQGMQTAGAEVAALSVEAGQSVSRHQNRCAAHDHIAQGPHHHHPEAPRGREPQEKDPTREFAPQTWSEVQTDIETHGYPLRS